MEKQEALAQDMQASEQQFRSQFDPASPDYHRGLQVVVPTGGDRVPDSMPTMYPEGYDPSKQSEPADYGELYRSVEANRSVYQNLKKELAKLGPIVEAFLRHEDHFKTKGDPTNEKHLKTYQDNVERETAALKAVQELLGGFVPTLAAMDEEGKESAAELEEIIHASGKKYSNKEELTDFNFRLKKLSAKTFSIAQKCLQRLKDIKKQHANNAKAAEKQETTA